ncbi:MAG: Hsp20/alpha crystallin family protein [Bacteroidota bacterium]
MKRVTYNRFPNLLTQFFDDPFTRTIFNDNWTNERKPAVNIQETEDAYDLYVVAPGRDKANFKVELDEGVLTIGYHTEEVETKEENAPKFLRKEYSLVNFTRRFNLDDTHIDADAIKATYTDGILMVSLPKKEEAKATPKLIEIG